MKLVIFRQRACAAALAAACFTPAAAFGFSAPAKARPALPAVKPAPVDPAADYSYRDATLEAGAVARVGSLTVSAEALRQRVRLLRRQAAMGHDDPDTMRQSALRQILDEHFMLQIVAKSGYATEPRVERMRVLYEKLYRANRYEREVIRPKLAVSEAEIAAELPRSREERRLRVLLLAEDADAEAIRREAAAGTAFADLVARHSRSGSAFGLKGDLGFQAKGGVYFAPADEDYLWTLPVGTVSRVVETRIGPALVLAEEARTLPDERWEAHRAQAREKIAQQRLGVYVRGIVDQHVVAVDDEALRRTVEAMLAEDRSTDAVIARVDGFEVWFHDVDRLQDSSFQDIFPKADAQEIAGNYRGFLATLTERLALAAAAEKVGVALDKRDQGNVRRNLDQARLRIAAQDAIRGVVVSAAEEKEYYEKGLTKLASSEYARLGVIVAENLEQARRAEDELDAGVPLAQVAAQYSRDKATLQHGGETGWQKVENLPPVIAENLDVTAVGGLLPLFRTPQGISVIRVLEKGAPKPVPFEKVRGSIHKMLLQQKRRAAVSAHYATARTGVRVEVDRKQLNEVPAGSEPAAPATAPHGGRR